MNRGNFVVAILAATSLLAAAAVAAPVREEHVTGGQLDLVWNPGYGLTNNMQPRTLQPSDPAYANPSGDHTVGSATNSMAPDSGGIILTATEPAGLFDYVWGGWVFTGNGDTRRGLVVRANPSNGFTNSYQFVLQQGLLQLALRKVVNQAGTTLASWFTNTLPGGVPLPNTWHHMKVEAIANSYRCFFDGYELTSAAPVLDLDNPLLAGWVGVYNFRFDLGGIAFLVDDLLLSPAGTTPLARSSWGEVKARYR
jgi:hypothetical protein